MHSNLVFWGRSLVFFQSGCYHALEQVSPNTAREVCSSRPPHCATAKINCNDTVNYRLSGLKGSEHSENRTASLHTNCSERRTLFFPHLVWMIALYWGNRVSGPRPSVVTHNIPLWKKFGDVCSSLEWKCLGFFVTAFLGADDLMMIASEWHRSIDLEVKQPASHASIHIFGLT